jgi:hypothetical protein
MKFLIAGGGAYGTNYVQKLYQAHDHKKANILEIRVVDKDPHCRVQKVLRQDPPSFLETLTWDEFGEQVWAKRNEWADYVWVPAPIAPHILADWVLRRVRNDFGVQLSNLVFKGALPSIPYALGLSDGRILLSHASGICPVDCMEPGMCSITKGPRFWEMKNTIADLVRELPAHLKVNEVAFFFCKHHCDEEELEVGGIPMALIYSEAQKVFDQVKGGAKRIAVATLSSCHGVLNIYECGGAV